MSRKIKTKKVKAYNYETKIGDGSWVKALTKPSHDIRYAARAAAAFVSEALGSGHVPVSARIVRDGKVSVNRYED